MATVDSERVLAQLKQRLAKKDSWGLRQLRELIAELEGENYVEEGMPERAVRLYGDSLQRFMRHQGESANGHGPAGVAADAHETQPADHAE